MSRGRALTFALAVLAVYALLALNGGDVWAVLTVGTLLLPVLGAYLLFRQLRLGVSVQRLARDLAEQGGLAHRDLLERGPDGRVLREVAEAELSRRRAEVDAAPEDWRSWFRYAAALGDVGDGRAARRAMRRSVELWSRQQR